MVRRGSGHGPTAWQITALVALAVVVVAMAGYVVVRDPKPPASGVTYTPKPTPTPGPIQAPTVPKVVAVDFAEQQDVPGGFEVFDTGLNESGMTVKGGRLVHGAPTDANGASYLEAELPQDAQRIGAVAEFPGGRDSGAVALIIWEDSLVAKRTDEGTLPRSGLHFVAYPGQWHIGVIDPKAEQLEDVVDRGGYFGVSGPQRFDLFRKGDTVWVVDPSGNTTKVTDPRLRQYPGRWVTWELYEPTTESVPAKLREVWAG